MRHFSPLPLAALAFALGCGDQPVTAPDSGPRGPRFGISDGAHSGGNDGFFFLPPVVKEPIGNPDYKDEAFHGGMKPHVRIWALPSAAPCLGEEPPFKQFAPEQILVADEKYHVNWDTKEKALVDDVVYRIVVCVGDVQLGYADVEHAPNRAELKNINTEEFVALVDGRTLPIKFRIETGALCQFDEVCTSTFVDKDVGGTFYAADQGAAIDFDPGVLPVDVVVTIERIPVLPGTPCVGVAAVTSGVFQQWEGCYRITTSPDIAAFGGFQGPSETNPARAIVAVCIEPGVPASVRDNLLLYKFDADGEPQLRQPEPVVPPFAFPCDGFQGTSSPAGAFTGFARDAFGVLASAFTRLVGPRPLYAVDGGLGCVLALGDGLSTFFWGLSVTATASAGDNQEAPAGSAVPIPPAITAVTAHDDVGEGGEEHDEEPVSGVPVVFIVSGGAGTLVNPNGDEVSLSDTVLTNAAGVAALPAGWLWRLGPVPEVINTLIASGPFEDGPVTFTATAVESGVIDFETYPNGEGTCEDCTITGEYVSEGLVFAFEPSEAFETPLSARLVVGGAYDPEGATGNHSVTAPSDIDVGGIPGTVVLYFPKAPGTVTLRVRGPDGGINPFPVSGYSGPGDPGAVEITRSGVSTYALGTEALGRQETITFTSPDGISRINVHMHSVTTLIDNVAIGDVPDGVINFETYPSGEAICPQGCDLTDDFADNRGVSFSFTSALGAEGVPLTTKTNASICEGSRIDPLGFGTANHLVTGPMGYPCGGGVAGRLTLTFDPAATEVRFGTRNPDGCSVGLLASTADDEDASLSIGDVFHYTSGNGFVAEQNLAKVSHSGGIASIDIFISGCSVYLDNLVIVNASP